MKYRKNIILTIFLLNFFGLICLSNFQMNQLIPNLITNDNQKLQTTSDDSLNVNEYGTNNMSYNDILILNPQPLDSDKWYAFYMGNLGTYDYNLELIRSGDIIAKSESGFGENEWIIWYPSEDDYFEINVTIINGGDSEYQYHFMNESEISPTNQWSERTFNGKGELLKVQLSSAITYVLGIVNEPELRMRIFGPWFENATFSASNDTPLVDLYAQTNTYYKTYFTPTVSAYYVILVTKEDNNMNGAYSYYLYQDNISPGQFTITNPENWTTDQTPDIFCNFFENETGVNVSSAQFAYSKDGNLTPENWQDVDCIYENISISDCAEDNDTGDLWIVQNNVPFNQDGVNNTIRFRVSDMAGNFATSAAFTIKIDSTAPSQFEVITPNPNVFFTDNQTPNVIAKFWTEGSGVNVSSVEYAYSNDGCSTPDNWAPVNGTYLDPACSIPAQDGNTSWIYTKVNEVQFNKDSSWANKIRFKAADIAGNMAIQNQATTIKIDTTAPECFEVCWEVPTQWYKNQTPTIICKANFDSSGINISSVEYAFSTDGTDPVTWSPIDGAFTDSSLTTPAADNKTGYIYFKASNVPYNQDNETDNKFQFRVTDMVGHLGTSPIYTIKIDTDIGTPVSLSVDPTNWTKINRFNTTWGGPPDLSGIEGVFYKFDSPPTDNFDGNYLDVISINSVIIRAPSEGNHTVYIWLKDYAGNIAFWNYSSVQIYYNDPLFPEGLVGLAVGSFDSGNFLELSNLLLFIIIGSVAAASVIGVYTIRHRGDRVRIKPKKISKAKISAKLYQKASPEFTYKPAMDEKIKILQNREIPIDSVDQTYDKELDELFKQNLKTISPDFKDKIMKLDIPIEDKVAILEEFKNLPRKYQKEFLKDLEENED